MRYENTMPHTLDEIISDNTPIEMYRLGDRTVHVKREDLCVAQGGPPFSKMRGVYAHMLAAKQDGVTVFGAVDTTTSMAGWGVSWLAQCLGVGAVVYYPDVKANQGRTPVYQQHCAKWGATVVPMRPAKSCVLWYQARRRLAEDYTDSLLLPTGLRVTETVTACHGALQTRPPMGASN